MTIKKRTIEFNTEEIKEGLNFEQVLEAFKEEITNYVEFEKNKPDSIRFADVTVDKLLRQKVVVNLYDTEGRIVQGNITEMIGWLEGDTVLLTGEVEKVLFSEEDK